MTVKLQKHLNDSNFQWPWNDYQASKGLGMSVKASKSIWMTQTSNCLGMSQASKGLGMTQASNSTRMTVNLYFLEKLRQISFIWILAILPSRYIRILVHVQRQYYHIVELKVNGNTFKGDHLTWKACLHSQSEGTLNGKDFGHIW